MRKVCSFIAIIACAIICCSCGDDFLQGLFELVSGNATSSINGEKGDEYTSSIAMFQDASNPAVLGLSMSIDVEDLMNLSNVDDMEFPFLSYRITGNVASNKQYYVKNELTEADLENFDYKWLINGKFADNNIVSVAVSDRKFYIMSSGTIDVKKVSKTKVKGSYSGIAYFIDLDATPMLSDELVTLSGEFTSRVIPMMKWLQELQAEDDEDDEIAGN